MLHLIGKPSLLYDTTNPDWVPSQDMGYANATPDLERYDRLHHRNKKRKLDVTEDREVTAEVSENAVNTDVELRVAHANVEVQTEVEFMKDHASIVK